MPLSHRPLRLALLLAVLFVAYVLAGKVGLALAFVNASASAVWPPTGLAIAGVVLLGAVAWPAILAGAFVVNLTTSGDLPSSFAIAIGNTLEALVAGALIARAARGADGFHRPQDVPVFALCAAVAPIVSATIGVAALNLGGLARAADVGAIWLTWWLGDASGALLVTPVVVLWARSRVVTAVDRPGELLLLALGTAGTGALVFAGTTPISSGRYPIAYLVFPVLIWAAFRFGPRAAATAALAVATIAVWGTLNGFGPYAGWSNNESLILLDGFMAVAATTTLTLAAAVFDRRRTVEEASRLREEFLSIATHELRTPVTSLSGYAQLAQRAVAANQPDMLPTALNAIVRQSARLSRLITRLLDVSRIESGQLRFETQPTDLSAVTRAAVELARLSDVERHRWVMQVESGIVAEVDPMRWEELVANLLDNAVKYTVEGRTVTVSLARSPDGGVVLAVADDGTGIPADSLPFVFDRFYRGHADEGWPGLGLGLYIARQIADGHDGRIGVSSRVGGGTTFTVTLPPGRLRSGAGLETAALTRVGRPEPARAGRRVLLVEDEPDVAAPVVEVLRESGHSISVAADGQKALDAVLRERPDVILLDKLMPVMDGTTFAHAYRAAVSDPAPIIAFCAARDAEAWARSIGAVAHVAKPFDVDVLVATVNAELETVAARTASSPSAR